MLNFFLTIIIVYGFWLVVRPFVVRYARRKFQQKIENMFRNAYGAPAADGQGSQQRRGNPGAPSERRRKIFSADEGEYVEFQEITEPDSGSSGGQDTSTRTYGNSTAYTPREPRISDVEWEELP